VREGVAKAARRTVVRRRGPATVKGLAEAMRATTEAADRSVPTEKTAA
jgi:hypothetical protein